MYGAPPVGDSAVMDDSADLGDETTRAAEGSRATNGPDAHSAGPATTAADGATNSTVMAGLSGPPDDLRTALIDLSGLSLGDLDAVGQTALGTALRRIVAREGEPTHPVLGFQSSILG
jgi:FXSXX-COOH protein